MIFTKNRMLLVAALLIFLMSYIFVSLFWSSKPNPNTKHLVVGRLSDSIGLDPAIEVDTESFQVTANIFETLVHYEKGGDVITPMLAESWRVSEDGLIWVFRIRQNIKFHDGTNLDASAIAFNFHRWMDLDSPYHTGQFSYWNYNFGGFPGIVRSVTALSDYTLEIVLNEPFAPFLSVISLPSFGIASPDAIMRYNENLKFNPVGTGPFKFKEWQQGTAIVLEKNFAYWGDQAKVDFLEFKVVSDSEDKLTLLSEGHIHIMDSLKWEELTFVRESDELNLHYRPFFNIGYLALNHKVPPFDNHLVRQAITYLIDKDEMLEKAFNPLARPANSFLPPLIMGHHEGLLAVTPDVDYAIKLLESAGYKDGFETSIWVMDTPRNYFPYPLKLANFIKEELSKANINVTIRIIPWDDFLSKIKDAEHPMALAGWNGDTIDPDNFLYTLFHSENSKPETAMNFTFYENPDTDFLLVQARRATNTDFRISLYREFQEVIQRDAISVPLVHTMTAIGTHESVFGYEPHITGQELYHKVDLLKSDE